MTTFPRARQASHARRQVSRVDIAIGTAHVEADILPKIMFWSLGRNLPLNGLREHILRR
ncbi:hypothetical protein [Sphingomonas sp.]|uniref:hypothetical protein n=1 Tax=Sphingomonas sp. TaxID=28214 RepID=UPI003F70FB81